jgi:TRAP-type C4-dicarboxylate transport system permease small subunit
MSMHYELGVHRRLPYDRVHAPSGFWVDRYPAWIAYLAWIGALTHALALAVLVWFGLRVLAGKVPEQTLALGVELNSGVVAGVFFILLFVGFALYMIAGYAAQAFVTWRAQQQEEDYHVFQKTIENDPTSSDQT